MSRDNTHAPRHAPLITKDLNGVDMGGWVRVVGCTCGWRTPHGPIDSDKAFAWHVAIIKVGGHP